MKKTKKYKASSILFNYMNYSGLPVAPTKEEIKYQKQDLEDSKRIPYGSIAVNRCPYCGHLMYTISNWCCTIPAPITCVHCGYSFSPEVNEWTCQVSSNENNVLNCSYKNSTLALKKKYEFFRKII